MSVSNLKFIDVSFSYTISSDPICTALNIHFSQGWTGIVGSNGAGKSTIAKIAAGLLAPTTGTVIANGCPTRYYCEQSTAQLPDDAEDFLTNDEPFAGKLRSILEVECDWFLRWNTLSHGERKRIQIGCALARESDVLILDEPVNHIDAHTKKIILSALSLYRGIGIIISHQREFLDTLCKACLFLNNGNALLRKGAYSEGLAQQKTDDENREKKYEDALEKYHDMKNRAVALKQRECGKESRLSKRNIAKHDHDAKSRIDGARLTGKDRNGLRKATTFERRAQEAGSEAAELRFRQRRIEGILFQGEQSQRKIIARLSAQSIPLGSEKNLIIPELEIAPSDRIAITGRNGCGKSTLISKLIPALLIDSEEKVYIPQEIDDSAWSAAQLKLRLLSSKDVGIVYDAVYRLGSEPQRLRHSTSPSPGEKRKILLSIGLLSKPALIIMDEPTNHLDLPSIHCMEEALRQFTGALIIVSHDQSFISATTEKDWEIVSCDTGSVLKITRR